MKQFNTLLALPAGMSVTALLLTSVAFAQETKKEQVKETKVITMVKTDASGKADVQVYEGAAADSFLRENNVDFSFNATDEAKQVKVFTTKEMVELSGDDAAALNVETDADGNMTIIHPDGTKNTVSFSGLRNTSGSETNEQELRVFLAQADDLESEIEVIVKGLRDEAEDEERVFAKSFRYAYRDTDAGVTLNQGEESGVFSYTLDVDEPTAVSVKVLDSKGTIVHKEKVKVKDQSALPLDLTALSNGAYEVLFETELKVRKARLLKR